jgi:hypothetical protein
VHAYTGDWPPSSRAARTDDIVSVPVFSCIIYVSEKPASFNSRVITARLRLPEAPLASGRDEQRPGEPLAESPCGFDPCSRVWLGFPSGRTAAPKMTMNASGACGLTFIVAVSHAHFGRRKR